MRTNLLNGLSNVVKKGASRNASKYGIEQDHHGTMF